MPPSRHLAAPPQQQLARPACEEQVLPCLTPPRALRPIGAACPPTRDQEHRTEGGSPRECHLTSVPQAMILATAPNDSEQPGCKTHRANGVRDQSPCTSPHSDPSRTVAGKASMQALASIARSAQHAVAYAASLTTRRAVAGPQAHSQLCWCFTCRHMSAAELQSHKALCGDRRESPHRRSQHASAPTPPAHRVS